MLATRKIAILVLDGATGAGKSTLLNHFRAYYHATHCVGRKLTTRARRPSDNDWEFKFVPSIPAEFRSYAFGSVNSQYAIDPAEFEAAVRDGKTYVVSCVDRNTIEKLRANFRTLCIYVLRIWKHGELDALLSFRGTSANDIAIRRKEVANVANEYASKVDLYDHVILNDGSTHLLFEQLDKILARGQQGGSNTA